MIGDKAKQSHSEWLRGFTLMEMLVALGLFAVVVTIGANLFFTFQQTGRRTESTQQVVAQARFILEQIAREIRSGRVHYEAYDAPVENPISILRLRDISGVPIIFSLEPSVDACAPDPEPCILMSMDEDTRESLTGGNMRARTLKFFISPAENPFAFVADPDDPKAGQFRDNLQPSVTVFLSIENTESEDASTYARYDLQTTISSRIYER